MPVVPFPEWLPDQPEYAPQGQTLIRNCTPLTPGSYGPMPTPQPWSQNALDARCQGAYSIKDADGGTYHFAGDATKLYYCPPSSETFTDASRTTGGAYTTPPISAGGHWAFTAFGKRIIATNWSDPMQTMLRGDTHFSLLAATAPRARYVTTVKDFLFVANTYDAVDGEVPYRCWWSALGNPLLWPTPGSVTAQQLQSDWQNLEQTDLGVITGLAAGFLGSADVAIFCERGLWTANYTGPPTLFAFRVVAGAPGCVSPLSIVSSRTRSANGAIMHAAFYLGEDGFCAFDGNAAIPIGAQKWDREIYRQINGTYRHWVQGVADPLSKLIFWGFASENSPDGLLDRVFVYNWELNRGVISELTLSQNKMEFLTRGMYSSSYNLDELDPFGDLDTIRPSFDDPFWTGAPVGRLSMFNPSHILCTWDGPAMAPSLDIPEGQPFPGRRAWVTNARPLIDGGDAVATVQVGHRERLSQPVIWEAAVPINVIGDCPQRVTGRHVRFRFAMPVGQTFTHLRGLDVTMAPEGTLR